MLTILSAKYGPARLLEWNAGLCRALNPGARYDWIVVNNDFDEGFASDSAGFTVVPGVPPPARAGASGQKDQGSLHHAAALMAGLRHVSSRYLLLLDQDFYVVRPDWIAQLISHAQAERLAFFGSVWHPRWTYQPRDFPSVHFMLIDLEQVPIGDLDFRPDMDGDRLDVLISDPRLKIPAALRTLLQAGKFRDTGWRVRERFRRSGLRSQGLVPAFDDRTAWCAAHPLHREANRWLPEDRRLIPRRSVTDRSFLRPVSQIAFQGRWEEFWWQGEPFAFHLRSVGRHSTAVPEDHAELKRLIELYSAGAPRFPAPRSPAPPR